MPNPAVAAPVGRSPLQTVDDVGRQLAISRGAVYGLIRSGQLASLKIGGCRRIEQSAIDLYLDEQRNQAAS